MILLTVLNNFIHIKLSKFPCGNKSLSTTFKYLSDVADIPEFNL